MMLALRWCPGIVFEHLWCWLCQSCLDIHHVRIYFWYEEYKYFICSWYWSMKYFICILSNTSVQTRSVQGLSPCKFHLKGCVTYSEVFTTSHIRLQSLNLTQHPVFRPRSGKQVLPNTVYIFRPTNFLSSTHNSNVHCLRGWGLSWSKFIRHRTLELWILSTLLTWADLNAANLINWPFTDMRQNWKSM